MRFMRCWICAVTHTTVVVVLLASPGAARSEVVVTDHARFYTVEGRTLDALRRELVVNGPAGQNGQHVAGLTVARVEWEAVYEEAAEGCRVAAHRVELDITTTLPRWTQRGSARQALRRRWDRAAAAVAQHEAGHRELAVQAAHALDLLIARFTTRARCVRASTDLQWEVWKLQQRMQRQHERFDRVTGSGTKRGAVL